MQNLHSLAWLPERYTVPGFLACTRDLTARSWRRMARKRPAPITDPAKRLLCAWLEDDVIILEFEDGHRETGRLHRARR
jgi:hypothetical protein